VVVYASTTVWTALWARWSGQHLSAGRWAGVLLVFAGMVLNSSQGFEQAAAESVAASTLLVLGLCAVVVGTMLHAAMFVYSELAIKQAHIDLLLLCAGMGLLESATLSLWNLLLLATMGTSLYLPEQPPVRDASSRELCLLYAGLTVINAVHAWAFFHMLEKVGAVSSAVMKGLQLVLVFAFSVTFFCQMQATQCFTWSKAAGVGVVALGLLVYAHSTATAASAKRKQTMS
jgi:drug/metabolite transporter (DMT)-like permease